ncbi:HAD-superfamily hydrolase, subfamily IA, variant 1 [Paludibacter propionicigenes WB4]|uniref:phosphoglycolate phosphatase n=1 Tax=Paludibacter propionicigenes (strain DSM 17365 / JCM 13257 / WB4) TaxID=694427 RepID=E4T574_PALPW|nr:HAD family hydrolase [Paludibacter propionicigenes]ADQ79868.1 HAD-superfamily hydrolase, subfamily IA, variant 1 [Paludibacter propionicigenes WB4]
MKTLVIFDLDGTLLDTVADLAASTNYALEQCGFPTHEAEAYKFFVGNGINKLFERALPDGAKDQETILKIRKYFIEYYNDHNSELTVPYPGISELLGTLQSKNIQLAVASNKYQQATTELIQHFFPDINFAAVFGQRENVPIKPNPAIVNDILAITGTERKDVLYIGDSGVDMQTAQNAGVDAAGVTWGFRPRAELEQFEPKYIIDNTSKILEIIA